MVNRNALITGGNRGIGRVCALRLAAAGARVIVAARHIEKCEAVAAEIRAPGKEALAIAVDMASKTSIQAAVSPAAKDFGPISILVNNAGITKDGLALRMKEDDWNSVLQTNLSGSFFAMQAVMQGMMKERWGRMINIVSVVGEMGNAGQANYVASKAGLIGMARSISRELSKAGVTANVVAPGLIDTDMTRAMDDRVAQGALEFIPAKRIGTAEEVAGVVSFLASEDASYISGAVIPVDGGMGMGH